MGIGPQEEDENEEDEEEENTPGLDLHAFDLYWEDIRIETENLLRELKHMPIKLVSIIIFVSAIVSCFVLPKLRMNHGLSFTFIYLQN